MQGVLRVTSLRARKTEVSLQRVLRRIHLRARQAEVQVQELYGSGAVGFLWRAIDLLAWQAEISVQGVQGLQRIEGYGGRSVTGLCVHRRCSNIRC